MFVTKLYFNEGECLGLIGLAEGLAEPEHTHAFELEEGQSTFTPRYSVDEEGNLVDDYPDLDDEGVAQALNDAITAEAEALAAELAAETA